MSKLYRFSLRLIAIFILVLTYVSCTSPSGVTLPPNGQSRVQPTDSIAGVNSTIAVQAVQTPEPLVKVFDQVNGAGKVTFTLPWQKRDMDIVQLDYNQDAPSPLPEPQDYIIIRPVIYAQVKAGEEVIHEFKPPMKMDVTFNPDDVVKAGGNPEILVLLILDHGKGRWSAYRPTFTYNDPEHHEKGGTASIFISEWTSHTTWGRPR